MSQSNLSVSTNWRLLLSETKTVNRVTLSSSSQYKYKYNQIQPSFVVANSNILLIGTSSQTAQPYWFLGASVSQFLYISPSSSENFIKGVQVGETKKVGLNKLTLIEYNLFDTQQYVIALEPPYWLEDVYLEVWQYEGTKTSFANSLSDLYQQVAEINNRLSLIEQKINASSV